MEGIVSRKQLIWVASSQMHACVWVQDVKPIGQLQYLQPNVTIYIYMGVCCKSVAVCTNHFFHRHETPIFGRLRKTGRRGSEGDLHIHHRVLLHQMDGEEQNSSTSLRICIYHACFNVPITFVGALIQQAGKK